MNSVSRACAAVLTRRAFLLRLALPCAGAVAFLVAVSGCATLQPDFETPSVEVTAVRPIPGPELVPRFEIGLRVVNPNARELSLRGLSYRLALNDFEVVEGVTSELPVVPAYGEAAIVLPAAISLIDGMRFVGSLMRGSRNDVDWRVEAKLDVASFLPPIRVREEGRLQLSTTAR